MLYLYQPLHPEQELFIMLLLEEDVVMVFLIVVYGGILQHVDPLTDFMKKPDDNKNSELTITTCIYQLDITSGGVSLSAVGSWQL